MVFDTKMLDEFYNAISAEDGMDVATFQRSLTECFKQQRSTRDIEDYRIGKAPWKKLRDEVVPVSIFLELKQVREGTVRFPLDDKTPDCWLRVTGRPSLGIEVTLARAQEKYHLEKELNEKEIGRGFIGVQEGPKYDKDTKDAFDKHMSGSRTMFTTEQALDATKNGILQSLSKKESDKSGTFYLLIQTKLSMLPKEQWRVIKPELAGAARNAPFQEVYVIADTGEDPCGFQIK